MRAAYGSPENYERHISSDLTFTEPAFSLATRAATAGAPTWLYRFGYVVEEKRAALPGAVHASDVPFQFDNLAAVGITPTPADLAAAKQVADYWTHFARTGDPNGNGLPVWPRLAPAAPVMLRLAGDKTDTAPADAPTIRAIAAARDAAKKK